VSGEFIEKFLLAVHIGIGRRRISIRPTRNGNRKWAVLVSLYIHEAMVLIIAVARLQSLDFPLVLMDVKSFDSKITPVFQRSPFAH
jgi:hypothetical protein